MGDEDEVDSAEGVDGALDCFLVLVEVVEVELVGVCAFGASYFEVVADGLEFFGVAGDKVEVGVVFGEVFCCFVGDGGGGSYDYYFHVSVLSGNRKGCPYIFPIVSHLTAFCLTGRLRRQFFGDIPKPGRGLRPSALPRCCRVTTPPRATARVPTPPRPIPALTKIPTS